MVTSSARTFDTAYRRVVQRTLERFWGEGAVDRLDAAARALVVDERPNGSLSDDETLLQRHNDVVATICMEMEWDPANLSNTQRRYIAMRPEFFGLHGRDE